MGGIDGADAMVGDPAAGQLGALLGELVGRGVTERDRGALRGLGVALREAGRVVDVFEAVTLDRRDAAMWTVDLDLLDAAIAVGVPVADPPAGVALRLAAWLESGRRRGDLAAVCAHPGFRPLLRDAFLDRRADLLALGRPAESRTHEGADAALLDAAGPLDLLVESLHEWVTAVRAGSLPALHEAVYHLDLVGPARLVERRPQTRPWVLELLTADLPALLAETWRTGLVDERGHRALERFDELAHSEDVYPVDLSDGVGTDDGFVVLAGARSAVFDARRRLAGPLFARLPELAGSALPPTHRLRFADGRLAADRMDSGAPRPDDRTALVPVGGKHSHELRRVGTGWWEVANAAGACTSRWYQGPARPRRASGSHSVGRYRHRWAAGSELVVPVHLWPHLTPRDKSGSRVLRAADRALTDRVLGAVDAELRARITEIGRRIGVCSPSREVDETFRALRQVIDPLLPRIRADRLLDGIAGTVWTAVECAELTARHLDPPSAEGVKGTKGAKAAKATKDTRVAVDPPGGTDPSAGIDSPGADDAEVGVVLRTNPRPYPRADAGDLRARYYTGMQDMFERIAAVAAACVDPTVVSPPQTVELVDAQGWEQGLGRLGAKALRLALFPRSGGGEQQDEPARDHLRMWGVAELADPGDRWRVLEVEVDTGHPPAQGTVCRTARGCLIALQRSPSTRGRVAPVLEYAYDGRFDASPFGRIVAERVCAGWGGRERIAALLRLHHDRGAAPWPGRSVAALAAAGAMSRADAAVLTAGFEPRDAYLVRQGRGIDSRLAEMSGLDPQEIADAARELSRRVSPEQRLAIAELLMPEDPADVWADRLAVERAASRWHAAIGKGV
ncbi:hypothetical protein [Embleya sp. NPDC050493]|uniref:hypothetical protein n=1 Tax=Embleya sp. NPDC050493 TaxID=3363989 RepID=UPI0037A7844B